MFNAFLERSQLRVIAVQHLIGHHDWLGWRSLCSLQGAHRALAARISPTDELVRSHRGMLPIFSNCRLQYQMYNDLQETLIFSNCRLQYQMYNDLQETLAVAQPIGKYWTHKGNMFQKNRGTGSKRVCFFFSGGGGHSALTCFSKDLQLCESLRARWGETGRIWRPTVQLGKPVLNTKPRAISNPALGSTSAST